LIPERWGSPLVQEKYQAEVACDKRQHNNNNNSNNNNNNNNNNKVQTDRTIPNNKPDIIIWDNEKGTCMLIDVVILGD
jgi:hypothetical protein